MMGLTLLTGATGFVGRQVLRALHELGVPVRVVVRHNKQSELLTLEGIERIVLTSDLFAESSDWWAHTCQGIDTIIHAAWYAEPGKYLQSSTNMDCLFGTLQLAKGAAQARVRRFIGIGTCFEYDLNAGVLPVETPLSPLTPYAGAKAAVFMALSQWLPMHHVAFAWCRLFYLYGEGEDTRRLVPYMHARLRASKSVELTSGNQIRDFMDVQEAAQCIVTVAIGNAQGPLNICSGVPISVRELAEKIADEYGRRDLLKFGARPDNLVDPVCVVGVKSELTR